MVQLALSRASYHVANRTLPDESTERLGSHWGRLVTSVFNLRGALKVTPASVERM